MYRALILLAAVLLAQGQVPAPVGGDMSNTTVKATNGTTARTLATRFPEVTAQDFSLAAGGGTADDTAAVQAAFNSGQPVFLIPGTYSVTCLTVPTGLTLRGAGSARTAIVQRSGSTCATLTGTGATDVSISGVTIDAASNGLDAILSNPTGARWRVLNNVIKNATSDCVYIKAGVDTAVSGNTIVGCGGHGITFTTSANQFAVTDNNISSVGGAGVIFSVGTDGSIKGNNIQNNGPNGDCITGYHMSNLRIAISGNSCLSQSNNGIHVGGTQITITGNNVYSPALTGIFVRATDTGGTGTNNVKTSNQVTVTGNNVYNTTTANQIGIFLGAVNNGTITGNVVVGATQNGIMISLSNYLTVTGNNVGASTGNGIDLRGTVNSIIAGNLVNGVTADAFRAEADTSNNTGAGTVNSTGNTITGNVSIGNNRDYIEVANQTNYWAWNNAAGATGGTSPVLSIQAGSIWNGTASGSSDMQLATLGGVQVRIKDTAATVNVLQLGGSATTVNPLITIYPTTGDASRNLGLTPKGAGANYVIANTGLAATAAALFQGSVTMSALPTTCTAQPSKSVASISGVLNLCP
jgi:parallel beta-helix repeat protein